MQITPDTSAFPTRHWHALNDGRVQCDVCPRACKLHEGQRGLCFVRGRSRGRIVLTTHGRAIGFRADPIEKKPLYHFLPGSRTLSFGTAGCNLACKFCQNWDMSKSREMDIMQARATPEELAMAARDQGCASVAFTYNDPVIFMEYATDTARACHQAGVRSVAVTAGYISPGAREEFFAPMDAVNVDLKAFDEAFYWELCGGHLEPVLDTLRYLRHETDIWLELTTLLIPGRNDDDQQLQAMTRWVVDELGPDVPMHFSAFHPDWRMTDLPRTPLATLQRARRIARDNGVRHAYIGNVHDAEGSTTWCRGCGAALVVRDGYRVIRQDVGADGQCPKCGARCAGRFA